jgi:anti-sigma factor RsiW
MTEPTVHDQLSAYLDGELGHAEAAEVSQRLQADPALRAELDEVRAAIGMLRAHGPATMPIPVQEAIRAAIAAEPAPRAAGLPLWSSLGVPLQALAVAAVALVVVGIAVSGATGFGLAPGRLGVGPPTGPAVGKADSPVADPMIAAQRAPGTDAAPAARGAAGGAGAAKVAVDAPVDGTDAPAASGDAGDAGAKSAGTADDPQGSPSTAPAALSAAPPDKGGPNLYGGTSLHTIGLREDDLPVVAKLLAKHGVVDAGGRDVASVVAELGTGEHVLALRLPDASARNAFVTDLARSFGARHTERVVEDGSLSLTGAQVALKLVVTPYVPAVKPK